MKSPTSAENALKSILESLGYIVIPYADRTSADPANTVYMQMPLRNFTPDFSLPFARICLEADGEYWHRPAQRKMRDRNRDAQIRSHGWQILRFQANLLERYPNIATQQVDQGINDLLVV